jgi:beta-lactamase superfamily II metal-dependent hydrolase
VIQHLESRGIETIDLAVVSHHHTDHYGGMDDVVLKYKPRYFLATKSGHVTSMYRKLLEDVKAARSTFLVPDPKGVRILKLGSVDLYVLPQPPESAEEENDNSVGIVAVYGNFSVLLTGDSEDPQRAWWLRTCPGTISNCTVLKLAHHGSRNGTDAHWLKVVDPEVAVVSLAAGNSYGHPHKEAVALLKEYAIPLHRTDEKGTITFLSNGKAWKIAGESAMASGGGSKGSSSGSTRKPTATARGGGDSFGRARK